MKYQKPKQQGYRPDDDPLFQRFCKERKLKTHDVITDGNRHDHLPTDSTGDSHGDMQTTTGSLMKELLERLAVLEYRVQQLENWRKEQK